MSIQNKALTVTFFWFLNRDLKTTPTFALEKQTRLERKQTRFILTLPVAGVMSNKVPPKKVSGDHILRPGGTVFYCKIVSPFVKSCPTCCCKLH